MKVLNEDFSKTVIDLFSAPKYRRQRHYRSYGNEDLQGLVNLEGLSSNSSTLSETSLRIRPGFGFRLFLRCR